MRLLHALAARAASVLLVATVLTGTAVAATGSDDALDAAPTSWPQFRGPLAVPVSEYPGLPSRWSRSENVEWVSDVVGMGWSSPIVWGDRVFLTTATSNRQMKQPSLGVDFSNDYVAELQEQGKPIDEVMTMVTARDNELPSEIEIALRLLCLDLESGEVVWERPFYEGPPPVGRHRKNSYASETPVTDGGAIYVLVGHLGLFAFDFEGRELWQTRLEAHQVYLDFGGGSSPAIDGDRLFVLNDNEEASFLAAFDKRSGERVWKTSRPGLGTDQRRSAWSTPFVWRHDLRTEIVTVGPGAVISYGLDGGELWRLGGRWMMSIQSPFSGHGLLYVTAGAGGEPDRPLAAVRPGASGELEPEESEHVAWYVRDGGGSYLPTPVLYRGGIYGLTDKGILTLHDATSGARIYRTRIHREARNFTASPWAYDGKVFAVNEEGSTFVIRAGEEFELLGINRIDEFTMATPAIVGDRLLIRTQGKLYSIREPAQRGAE